MLSSSSRDFHPLPNPLPQVRERGLEHDARATALSYGSSRILEAAGAWRAIKKVSAPMREIRVADGDSPLFLHFDSAADGKGQPFGWNLENARLRRILFENIRRMKAVRYLAPVEIRKFFRAGESVGVTLKDGRQILAPLMVGADGRHSAVRGWLGIAAKTVDYKQTAIVCNMAHEIDHDNVAVEHFMPDGPFAILPLPPSPRTDGERAGVRGFRFRSSIVWTVPTERAKKILALPPKDFDAELQKICGNHWGRVRHVSPPRGYPLSLMHATDYVAPRVALLADAAHVIHPLAGQGLNLGLRDAALLAELIVEARETGGDAGADTLLRRYARLRRVDTRRMVIFTDILNRSFSNKLNILHLILDLGLITIHNIGFLRRFFARQAMGVGKNREGRGYSGKR